MNLQLRNGETMKIKKKIEDFHPEGMKIDTEDVNGRRTAYIFEEEMCNALWAAYANGRPLLLRGDPGTGKSELAYAIAAHLGWPLVKKVIQGNTELDDLHFRFDAVQRLADAQLYCHTTENSSCGEPQRLAIENYISPGPIWWAFNWSEAEKALENVASVLKSPARSQNWKPGDGCVLLIDEIDKADPDLPNGLLETFGNYCFEVPLLGDVIHASQPVLTIITTNEERDLPLPFLRRCLELELKLETDEEKRDGWLVERGKLHYGVGIDETVYTKAASLVWQQRERAKELNRYQPGLAEYLDLLNALSQAEKTEQGAILKKISSFVLKKG
jgi:MoxR-like ATPase